MSGKKGYLRILTPQTIDGVNLKYDEATNQVILKESFAPLTSRKYFEKENEVNPRQLWHRFEEVYDEEKPKEFVNKSASPAIKREADAREVKPKGKPGPKKKEPENVS